MEKLCPACKRNTYDFEYGIREADHRFGGSEPDSGYCSTCGFQYQEHIDYPEREMAKKYRKSEEYRRTLRNSIVSTILEKEYQRGYKAGKQYREEIEDEIHQEKN